MTPRDAYIDSEGYTPENIVVDRIDNFIRREGPKINTELMAQLVELRSRASARPLLHSNEFEFNDYILALQKNSEPLIREFLEKLYIDVRVDKEINAMALGKSDRADLNFIQIFGGLYNLLDLFSNIIARTLVFLLIYNEEPNHSEVSMLESDIELGFGKIQFYANYAETQSRDGAEITQRNWQIIESTKHPILYVNYYQFRRSMFAFVIGHELGHHFLGHTSKLGLGMRERIKPYLPQNIGLNARQLLEIEADLFSVLLYFYEPSLNIRELGVSQTDIAFGALLGLLAIGFTDPAYLLSRSDEYPSINERFHAAANTVKDVLSESEWNRVKVVLNKFVATMSHRDENLNAFAIS